MSNIDAEPEPMEWVFGVSRNRSPVGRHFAVFPAATGTDFRSVRIAAFKEQTADLTNVAWRVSETHTELRDAMWLVGTSDRERQG